MTSTTLSNPSTNRLLGASAAVSPSRWVPPSRWAAFAWLLGVGVLGIGCSSVEGTATDLLASEPPLEQVGLADVESASSSCEGLLTGVTDFAVLGETGLIVGLDGAGSAVCIDTVEAVNSELDDTGRETDAVELIARYETTMSMRGLGIQRFAPTGDPDPEPNSPQFMQRQSGRPGI